jgi:hypothetical protein
MFDPRLTAAITSKVGLWEELEGLIRGGHTHRVEPLLAQLSGFDEEMDAQLTELIGIGPEDASIRRLPL